MSVKLFGASRLHPAGRVDNGETERQAPRPVEAHVHARISAISFSCSIVVADVVQVHVCVGFLNSALKQAPLGCVFSSLVDDIVVYSSSVCEAGVPCEARPSSRYSRTSAR